MHNGLLIQKAQCYASQNLLIPLRTVTLRFLSNSPTEPELNLYLQSLSRIPYRSAESTHTVLSLLAHIDQRGYHVSASTYRSLLNTNFTTPHLARHLYERISNEQKLSPLIASSLLRVFAKLGHLHEANQLYSFLKSNNNNNSLLLSQASTLLLNAQPSTSSAFQLAKLANLSTKNPYNSTASLHVLSNDLSISSHTLVNTFLRLSPSLPLYTTLIKGLTLRKRHTTAAIFFQKLLRSKELLPIDNPALASGIEALVRSGKPHLAFQVLENHSSITISPLPILSFLVSLNRISRPDISLLLFILSSTLYGPSCAPTSQSLSVLLQSARLGGNMDDRISAMGALIGGRQEGSSFTKYLRSMTSSLTFGKLGSKTRSLLGKIKKTLGKNLGFQHLIRKPLLPFGKYHLSPLSLGPTPKGNLHTRTLALNTILTSLGHPSRGGLRQYLTSHIQGIPAPIVGRLVFLRVLAGIDLDRTLPNVRSPVLLGYDHEKDPPTHAHALDSFSSLLRLGFPSSYHPSPSSHFSSPTFWSSLRFSSGELAYYPTIIPTNANFFNYILLVGLSWDYRGAAEGGGVWIPRHLPSPHSPTRSSTKVVSSSPPPPPPPLSFQTHAYIPYPTPTEIPLILAWMRALSIQPSKSTLALSLVFWAEICALSSSSSSSSKRNAKPDTQGEEEDDDDDDDPYTSLVTWLRDWVGEKRLPHWRTLEKWKGIVRRMRGVEE